MPAYYTNSSQTAHSAHNTKHCPQHTAPTPSPPTVGDVHERWCAARDAAALRALRADHALFVGDLGNREDVELVTTIARLDHPKSVILGNHGARARARAIEGVRRAWRGVAWRGAWRGGGADGACVSCVMVAN